MNTTDDASTTPSQPADGSTQADEEQKSRTDSLPDGSDTDAESGDSEQDTTSGGSPEQP
jgi:hypothetical protein